MGPAPAVMLHNLITMGLNSIRSSLDMYNWTVSTDNSMAQLSQLGEGDLQIKRAATLLVMSIMSKFPEHKRENFRAEVRKYSEKNNERENIK